MSYSGSVLGWFIVQKVLERNLGNFSLFGQALDGAVDEIDEVHDILSEFMAYVDGYNIEEDDNEDLWKLIEAGRKKVMVQNKRMRRSDIGGLAKFTKQQKAELKTTSSTSTAASISDIVNLYDCKKESR